MCGPTSIVGAQDDLDGRLTKDARARLEAAIAEVVAVEAPIELDALTRKIGKRFGYQRVAHRWKKKIAYRIPGGVLVDEGSRSFVWPEGSSPATWRGYRASDGARTIAEIPTTELANAIVAAVGDTPEGLDHEGAYRRYRMPDLVCPDQATGLPVRRTPSHSYVHDSLGDMVHMDIKKLSRIPDSDGWRKLGRGNDNTKATPASAKPACTTSSTDDPG